MAVAFRATSGNTANATSINVTVPASVQVGDLIVIGHAMAAGTSSRTVTFPSGFNQLSVSTASGHGSTVGWKIATSSELSATLNLAVVGGSIKQVASLVAYSGTHQTAPINQWANSTPSGTTSHTTPTTTATTVANCLKLEFAFDSTSVTPNSAVWTPPSGVTSRQQQFTTGSGASSVGTGDTDTTLYATNSVLGGDTWTSDAAGLGSAWALAIAPPPTSPSVPQSVMATGGNSQVTITWSAPATNGGSTITGYTITGLPSGTATVGGSTLTATITGLTNGTTYAFKVHATNSVGDSPESAFSNNVIPAAPLPTAPQNIGVTAGDSQATVTWFAPVSNGGSPITSYTVTAVPGGQTFTTSNGSTLTGIVSGLSNGSAYYFTVHATTIAGNGPESAPSDTITPVGNMYQANEKVYYNGQWVPVVAGYSQIQYQGSPIVSRSIVNFSGDALSIADNPSQLRTDITVTASTGGGGGSGGLPAWVINVKDYGAVGDGTTDDSAAVKSAFTAAIAGRGANTAAAQVVQRSLYFPPGTYRITQADSLVFTPETGTADQAFGLTIEGAGNRVSDIFFDTSFTANVDPRRNNLITSANRLRYTHFKNLSFRSGNGANNFAYFWSRDNGDTSYTYPLYGVGQNQYTVFEGVEWRGTWNRVIGIDGDQQANNNSEWTFRNCSSDTLSTYTDAFLHCGITNPGSNSQQDQFLNFWIDDCNWALASGTMFLFDRGGSINVHSGSWSMIGTGGTCTYFKMNRSSDMTATRLLVEGVRFEPKGPNHKIIDCNWEVGNVTFISCSDIASLQDTTDGGPKTYNTHNYTATSSNRVPIVRYMDCILAGYHTVTTGSTTLTNGKIMYEGCRFYHWSVATGASGFLRATGAAFPAYAFRDSWNIADVSG